VFYDAERVLFAIARGFVYSADADTDACNVAGVSCNVARVSCNITGNTCNITQNICNITRITCNIKRNTCSITRVCLRVRVRRLHRAIARFLVHHLGNGRGGMKRATFISHIVCLCLEPLKHYKV